MNVIEMAKTSIPTQYDLGVDDMKTLINQITDNPTDEIFNAIHLGLKVGYAIGLEAGKKETIKTVLDAVLPGETI